MEDTETRKINRHGAQVANRVAFWCNKCDRNHVTTCGKHRKCSLCGWRGDKPHGKVTMKAP